jgi:hypothetical protein
MSSTTRQCSFTTGSPQPVYPCGGCIPTGLARGARVSASPLLIDCERQPKAEWVQGPLLPKRDRTKLWCAAQQRLRSAQHSMLIVHTNWFFQRLECECGASVLLLASGSPTGPRMRQLWNVFPTFAHGSPPVAAVETPVTSSRRLVSDTNTALCRTQ